MDWHQPGDKPLPELMMVSLLTHICITRHQWVDAMAACTLHWCHNDHDGVSNHQPHECLLNRLFRCRSKKTSKLRVTGLCVENSPGTTEFPAQMASNTENVSIWWHHHEFSTTGVNSTDQQSSKLEFAQKQLSPIMLSPIMLYHMIINRDPLTLYVLNFSEGT